MFLYSLQAKNGFTFLLIVGGEKNKRIYFMAQENCMKVKLQGHTKILLEYSHTHSFMY